MLCRCQLLSIALLLVAHTKMLEKMDGILTREHFLLFSQNCLLRNTADLLHFMLHRLLYVTTVKIVCCHIAIVHLATKTITRILLILLFKLNLVLTLTEDIIIQSEPEKQIENQISEKKF